MRALAGDATIAAMRIALALVLVSATSHADVIVGGAVGAGGQGTAAYSALELRFDGASEHTRFGLGGRAVWLDGDFRAEDWDGWRAVRVLRLFEASKSGDTQLAIAAGGLAPAQLGHVADGYRATLDDRPRTGVRGSALTKTVALGLEIDDVVEPHLIGGALEVGVGEQWIGCASAAIDPGDDMERAIGAVEVCGARRWAREGARLDAGGGLVGERLSDGRGLSALGFVRGAFDARGARWTGEAEVRAGGGSVGGLFGPLHRLEEHADDRGVGAAISFGVSGARGWTRAFARYRAAGPIAGVTVGAPAGKWFQIAGWIAASDRDRAGATELRVTWAKRLTSVLELARMHDVDAMQPAPVWSAMAWFAIQQEVGRHQ